jgi:hypothetical protein
MVDWEYSSNIGYYRFSVMIDEAGFYAFPWSFREFMMT